MKKILFLLFVFVFILTGCGKNEGVDKKLLTTYDNISYSEYISLMESDATFPLVIGSSTCSACSSYKITMDSFIKNYQIDVKYIDLSELTDEDYNLLRSEINFSSTPTTIFVVNGNHTSVYDRLIGAETPSVIISKFTKMGYISGE